MKEYLADIKITKKFMKLDFFVITTGILIIILGLLLIEFVSEFTWANLIIGILLFIVILVIIGKVENSVKNKYNKLFKLRNKYYVIKLDKFYNYENLVLTLEKIKNRKMCLNQKDVIMFRHIYGYLNYNVYRINVINSSNFKLEEYQNRLKKLNCEYESKFGSDYENYAGKKFYGYHDYVNFMHKINIVYSNELNNELSNFISKNFFNRLLPRKTSQTIVIVGDKMYIPSIRTIVGLYELRKYNKALDKIFKWFDIEAS